MNRETAIFLLETFSSFCTNLGVALKRLAEEEKTPEKQESGKPREAPEVKEEKKELSFQDFRTEMTNITRKGKGDIVQKVLEDYGVKKLSEIKKEDYDDVLTRVLYFAGELEVVDA